MDISLICLESNISLFVSLNIDYTSSVLLTTNSKEGNNMFCPGEPIIVKCSVLSEYLQWNILESSLVIERKHKAYLHFNLLYPNAIEDSYIYLNSSAGLLNFYRNETYAGLSLGDSHSFINSELHMHLNHPNDFIIVRCFDLYEYIMKTINITTFPGMLNIARKFFWLL